MMTSPQPQAQDPPQNDQNTTNADAIAELQKQVASLTEQVKKLTELAGRAQADLQNAKVRMEKDADDMRKFAGQAFLLKLLPVIDNLQRAFSQLPVDLKDHPWMKGMTAVEQDFLKQLGEMGLKKMEAMGEVADPQRHEILMLAPGPEGKVVQVLENGYELHGRVLRPAKVKVGDGKK